MLYHLPRGQWGEQAMVVLTCQRLRWTAKVSVARMQVYEAEWSSVRVMQQHRLSS
jgi:hypothetical protein